MPLLFCPASGAAAGLPAGRAVFPAAPVSGRVQSVISSSLMRYLLWLLKFVLFVLILSFAIKNTDTVTVRYYLGYEWQAPLVLVLLVFFGLGTLAGIVASLSQMFRQRREIVSLRRERRAEQRGTAMATRPHPPDAA